MKKQDFEDDNLSVLSETSDAELLDLDSEDDNINNEDDNDSELIQSLE